MIKVLSIQSDYSGFQRLIELNRRLLTESETGEITLDLSAARWIDGNMCSALGAILHQYRRRRISLHGLSDDLSRIFQKNGFLPNSGFDRPKLSDTYKTTIEYKRFAMGDQAEVQNYVNTNLKGKGMPKMTSPLRKKLLESVHEIFLNANMHSESKDGIFSCGQYYPRDSRLDFSIVDLGIGMKNRILKSKNLRLTGEKAIEWSMAGGNTTREGRIPGGLGLKILREFIELNGGRLLIVSDDGYWELRGGSVRTSSYSSHFPGTAVNIEINAGDKKSYKLSTEVDPDSIF